MYYTIQRNRDRGVAQFGRALRSGRRGRVFESRRLDSFRPDGQAVKTTPSHGVNPGSIPGQVILVRLLHLQRLYFFILNEYAIVAQLVAQRIRNAWVAGSSPASGFKSERKISLKSKENQGFPAVWGVFFVWFSVKRG